MTQARLNRSMDCPRAALLRGIVIEGGASGDDCFGSYSAYAAKANVMRVRMCHTRDHPIIE